MWDPDGAGPLPAQLIAGGAFTTADGATVNRIARWDGSTWQALGSGVDGAVFALTTWDPDGDGPQSAQLVAGGELSAGSVVVSYIARWDGLVWHALGSGFSGGPGVYALTTWDPDGSGPIPPQLVAGGAFTTAGGVTVNRIARWDGSTWQPMGSGVNGPVSTLTTWDPDGAGPLPAELVAGGLFTTSGGVVVSHIAKWSISSWQPMGSGVFNATGFTEVNSLTTWDPDGAGPLPPQLVAGGWFTSAGGVNANRIARWDGSSWQPFDSGTSGRVQSLTTWDPDGDGPLPAQLVAGGEFTTAGGMSVNYITRWDDSAWQALGSGMGSWVYSLTTWDPDGAGPLPEQLVAGGVFNTADGLPARFMALWSTLAPTITQQPVDDSFGLGSAVKLRAVAGNGQPTYQWRKDGLELLNGTTDSGSIISGATSPTLTISNAQTPDAGPYDVVVTNSCGQTTSDTATLTPPPTCAGDANGDSQVDGADLSLVLALFGQSVAQQPLAGVADFNGDGVVNGADLSVLLFRFGTAC